MDPRICDFSKLPEKFSKQGAHILTPALYRLCLCSPLQLDGPVVAVWEALVEYGDPAGRAGCGLVAASRAGAVAAPVQSPRAEPLASPLASDAG